MEVVLQGLFSLGLCCNKSYEALLLSRLGGFAAIESVSLSMKRTAEKSSLNRCF